VSNYKYLALDQYDLKGHREKTLALGDGNMMYELKVRIERLLDDSIIRQLVKTYHELESELQSGKKADQLENDIKGIWDKVYYEGAFLKGEGHCTNIDKCRVNPKRNEEIHYA
jgi:hypothetical protein